MNKYYGFVSQQIIVKNHLNGAKVIGSLMALMNEKKPMSKEEWQSQYVAYVNEKQLPLDWAIDTAYGYAVKMRPQITREDIKECFKNLIVDKTWEGRQRELNFHSWLKKRTNKRIEHAPDELDRRYAVDYLLYEGSDLVGAIQVKPMSYFNYAGDDYNRNQYKYAQFKEKFGVKVIEVAFEGNDVVLGKNKLMEVA